MKLSKLLKHRTNIVAMAGALAITGSCMVTSAYAEGWENEVSIYGWFSGVSGEVQNGTTFSYDLDDIVDNLEMVLMGGYEGRINKWSFIADLVYLNVGGDGSAAVPVGTATADVDLATWVTSAGVGYDLIQSDKARLAVVGGVRYINMALDSNVSVEGAQIHSTSDSEGLLDGTLGLRGHVSFGEDSKWFIPYYADIGTGGSEVSYQLFGGLGYAFGWGDVRVGYRHLSIEMDDDKMMSNLSISGPVVGVGFRF